MTSLKAAVGVEVGTGEAVGGGAKGHQDHSHTPSREGGAVPQGWQRREKCAQQREGGPERERNWPQNTQPVSVAEPGGQ